MTSLVILFGIERATGSFAVAGAALGAFSATSLAAPFKSRLVDRYGQRRVLVPLAAGCALVLGLLAWAVAREVTAAAVHVGSGALVGLCAPPVGPSIRAVWASLTPDPAARQRAYSLDTVAEEAVFAVGPVLGGALVAAAGPVPALAATAGLLAAGTAGMALSPAAARVHAEGAAGGERATWRGPFAIGGFALLVAVVAGLAVGLGPIEVAVVARATEADEPAAAGFLLAALSVGSGLGGLAWGRVKHTTRPSTQLTRLVAFTCAALALAAVATLLSGDLVLLGLCLALTGAAIAPGFIVVYLAVDALVPAAIRTEATTWVNTAHNVGAAAGMAGAGLVVEAASPGWALLAGAGVLLPLLAGLVVLRNSLDVKAQR